MNYQNWEKLTFPHLAAGSASTFSASRSRVANLPHSRPTLPAEQDDDDDMQEWFMILDDF